MTRNRYSRRRIAIGHCILLASCSLMAPGLGQTIPFEVRSYDGTNNNLAFANWGAANQPRVRIYPALHSFYDDRDIPLDERNSNLPSARRVMEKIFHKTKPHKDKGVSHMLLEFGHFIVQDILGSRYNFSDSFDIPCDGEIPDYVYCPVSGAKAAIRSIPGQPRFEMNNNIPSNESDANLPPHTIPFHRDVHVHTSPNNPRATINGMTSFLDLSNLYGVNHTNHSASSWEMRHQGGKLALAQDGLLGEEVLHDDLKAGINTSPGAYCLYIVFIRYHNLVADQYHNNTPSATDEEIFEYARRQTIAVYQNLVEEYYIPTLLSVTLDPYQGYNPAMDPSMDEFFAAVAFRYAHSSFSNLIRILDESYQPTAMDPMLLRDVFKNNIPGLVRDNGGIEPFLRGLSITQAKAVDPSLVDDFNFWAEATSVLDVQRGRDVGIPRYNDVREAFGLDRMSSFEELAEERYSNLNDTDYLYLVSALKELYQSVEDVDAYVGALIEAPEPGLELGPLMTLSIKNQFTRLRDGDRFWYKNLYPQEEYESFPDLSAIIKLVCGEEMDLFPEVPFQLTSIGRADATAAGSDGVCSTTGSTNSLSLLGGDFSVRWHVDESDPADKTIDVTLSVQEEMEGPGYLGIGWEKLAMKGAHIWFCTVNNNALLEHSPMPADCSTGANSSTSQLSMFSCCLAPGTHHNMPECSNPDDELYYPLEVTDWCISSAISSVTVRAPLCSDDTTVDSPKRSCFRMESTDNGNMDFIVAYNTIANSRPHGFQRRTYAQVDLAGGVLTQSEASTADDGLIATHGAFMLIGWMLLAPWGVFIVRYLKTWKKRLVAHISIMGVVGSMMVPLLIGVEASVGATDKTAQHALVGLIIMCMFFLMAGTGRFRYLKWEGHKIGRKTDRFTLIFHKYGGAIFIGLAWWNCYTGLCRIGPEDSEFQLVLFSNLHLGYDIHAFGTIRDYVYGPYIAFVVVVFIIAEIRLIRMANASQSALRSGKGLWGDEDDSHLDTMTLETFLDVTRLGNALCVVDGRVLDITQFIDTHPGGPELLRYVRGSDITEEFVGHRDVDGIKHVHSHGALMLMKKFVKAKLIDAPEGQLPKGRGSVVPGLKHSILRDFQQAERSLSQPFRRGKVVDVRYLAPSASAKDQSKPVILLRLALPRCKEQFQEKKVTKLPGCSFRFRGIDKRGLMFEREYTAVLLERHASKERTMSRYDSLIGTSQISLRQLDILVGSSTSLVVPEGGGGETKDKDEIYDFVISLIPGGQMSEFFLGLKTGKLLLAQGPKVSPKTVYKVESEKWRSVVMVAGGTGITSMLQIIDYYLGGHGGRCPMLYLIWVLKSRGHNYHGSLGLQERVRKSKGRLRWITVYSASCDDIAEDEKELPEESPITRKSAPRRAVSGPAAAIRKSFGVPKRSISGPPAARRPAAIPRFRAPPRRNVSFDDHSHSQSQSNNEEPPRPSTARASIFTRPSVFTQNILQGNRPNLYWMKNRTRLNVRDLISFVRDDGFSADDVSLLGTDKRVKLDVGLWHKTPRQMTRHLDETMLKELLCSTQAYTKQFRAQQEDLSESASSLPSIAEGSDEESAPPDNILGFLKEHVPIEDRKDGMRLHKACFVACEAIDYLVSYGQASSREHAVTLCRELQEKQQIQHVTVGCAFSDDNEFFRISQGHELGVHANSAELATVGEEEIDLSSSKNDISFIFGKSDHTDQAMDQSLPNRRPLLERSVGEWDVEEGSKDLSFKHMLVAVSGSPMFEVGVTEMLAKAGLPREQILTFVAPTK